MKIEGNKQFDALTFGEIMLRLSPTINERIVAGEMFEKCAGGAELNVSSGISLLGSVSYTHLTLPTNSLV